MTKQQELDALRKFTESIPQDSYLRPWLEEVFPSVEADIRNDFPVAPTIKATRERCSEIIGETNTRVAEMIAQAQKKADQIEEQARREFNGARSQLETALSACRHALYS